MTKRWGWHHKLPGCVGEGKEYVSCAQLQRSVPMCRAGTLSQTLGKGTVKGAAKAPVTNKTTNALNNSKYINA